MHREHDEQTGRINKPPAADGEISIIDLFLIIIRRKWTMIGVFAVIVLSGLLYLLVAGPVYQSRAVLVVGEVGEDGLMENPPVLVGRIKEKYRVGDDSEGPRELPYLATVSLSRQTHKLVELIASARTPEDAQVYLERVVENIIQEHTERYKSVYSAQRALVEAKSAELNELNRKVQQMTDLIDSLKASDSTQASFLLIELGEVLERKGVLDKEYRELQIDLTLKSNPSKVLREPTLAVKPASPKVPMVLSVCVLSGLLAGALMAFLVEFLCNARNEIRRQKA